MDACEVKKPGMSSAYGVKRPSRAQQILPDGSCWCRWLSLRGSQALSDESQKSSIMVNKLELCSITEAAASESEFVPRRAATRSQSIERGQDLLSMGVCQ
jgi:hypothetical protein